ncbi:integration host factor subunit beta [Actinobacillus delphinicola]|uniref:Integration host factor subunit beta n=1 Tax=Actinobacillus delphinicola TaxID=51161 RepID=A0A448TSX3_9PAST|nr:integration host factor subunit beta [Actinobacillus delphinicola]MDG6897104.1 integration host factor subunit beta [Actinobacillus delphinicola]VEJ08921.1 integration host factor subunit beta [Actinobacillus delphinicola]
MTKSELVEKLTTTNPDLSFKQIDLAVKMILDQMSESLEEGKRIEVRGFGSFSLHFHQPRAGRNPRTGESVQLPAKSVPHFKVGKELRERVDFSA